MHTLRHLTPLGIAVLLGLCACAQGEGDPVGSDPALLGAVAPLPAELRSGAPTHLVMFAAGVTDPWFLVQEYGLEVVLALITGGIAGVSGDLDFAALATDPRIRAVQSNGATAMTAPSDLTMAFFEGTFDGSDLTDRLEFAGLLLDRVHGHARGAGVRIAILDTGVDPEHPHLIDRVEMASTFYLGWPEELAEGIDEDQDGQVDEAYGHGTHVAGIIGTVAPQATLVPIRVLDSDGIGTAYELAVGIRAAIDRGVDVINMSISIDEDATVVQELLRDARQRGIVIVAAAGNTGDAPTYPAAYDFVLGTAATDLDPTRIADFSARGTMVEMAAPGTSVLSSFPGGAWATATGSSMAAAVLSGAIAVVRSSSSELDGERTLRRVILTASPLEPAGSVLHGRVDLLGALVGVPRPERRLLQPTTLNGAH